MEKGDSIGWRQKYRILLPFVLAATIWFLLFIWLGAYIGMVQPQIVGEVYEEMGEVVETIEQLPPSLIAAFIFVNNSITLALIMWGGLLFGIIPLFILMGNGLVIGVLMGEAVANGNAGLFFTGVLPHGVLELPAVLIGAGVGLLAGWRLLFNRSDFKWKEAAKEMLVIFAILALVLLVAAVIEVYLTTYLLHLFYDVQPLGIWGSLSPGSVV